jgi:hypothetical protein
MSSILVVLIYTSLIIEDSMADDVILSSMIDLSKSNVDMSNYIPQSVHHVYDLFLN